MSALIVYYIGLCLWAVFVIWRWRSTLSFAKEVYALRKTEGTLRATVTEEEYVEVFTANEGPRGSMYLLLSALILTLLLAPFVWVTNYIWTLLWSVSGGNQVFEVGTLVHSFFLFVMVGAFMGIILAFAMNRFYSRRPLSLHTLEKIKDTQDEYSLYSHDDPRF